MGKRGPKPKRVVSEKWSPELAYALGLLATDGCLSRRDYLIDLTSKDKEQLYNFSKCLGRPFHIGRKKSGAGNTSYRVQFKNVYFYNFLLSLGFTPAKSKTLGALKIPDRYFFDFLRGVFDGDGSVHSYYDQRWASSFMFYTLFASASEPYVRWLQEQIYRMMAVKGHITKAKGSSIFQLKFAKKDSLALLPRMYHSPRVVCLSRKRLKIEKMLGIVGRFL